MSTDDFEFFLPEGLVSFPEADARFTFLSGYIADLPEFIQTTYEQKCLRLKAEVESEKDDYEKIELLNELEHLKELGLESLAHIVWGGTLVTIFGTFENSVSSILVHCATVLGKPKFKVHRDKGFIRSAHAYATEVLGVSLFNSKTEYILLRDLGVLRNSYVHNGCSVLKFPEAMLQAITGGAYGGLSLAVENGVWRANEKNTKLFFKATEDCFRYFHWQALELLSE